MNTESAIRIEGVGKRYPVFEHPWQAVRYLAALIRGGKSAGESFAATYVQALTDINLTIRKGERVGFVGRNGVGKSTLLKLLAGDFTPSTGRFFTNGKIYCLLPGSVSFVLEQSVRENARQYLDYLELSPGELKARMEDIREFTELGEYFDQPVKNLSLGMRVRAEFAVATAQASDIVIIDEVLGAGDIYWSEKIARRMDNLCADGTTLLLVSHSLAQINRYCERAIWLERGKVVMDGPALEVTKSYEGFLERLSWQTNDLDDKSISLDRAAVEAGREVLPDSGQTVARWPGRGDILVSGVWLNDQPVQTLELDSRDTFSIRLRLRARRVGTFRLRYLATLWDAIGKRVAVMENDGDELFVDPDADASEHDVVFTRQFLGLKPGKYHLSLTVTDSFASAGTTSEHAIRLDVIYKSFELDIKPGANPESAQPVYRSKLEMNSADDA